MLRMLHRLACLCAPFLVAAHVKRAAAPVAADPVGPTLPWGIHLAQGADAETQMTVMWSTRAAVPSSVVTLDGKATYAGDSYVFTDVGNTQTIHRVYLTGLKPSTTYTYTVGDGANATSPAFHFSTAPYDHVPTAVVYGDMGISANAQATMPWLISDAAEGRLDGACAREHACRPDPLPMLDGKPPPRNPCGP